MGPWHSAGGRAADEGRNPRRDGRPRCRSARAPRSAPSAGSGGLACSSFRRRDVAAGRAFPLAAIREQRALSLHVGGPGVCGRAVGAHCGDGRRPSRQCHAMVSLRAFSRVLCTSSNTRRASSRPASCCGSPCASYSRRERGFIALLAAAAAMAIPVALLSAINRSGGSVNLLTASFVVGFDWRNVVHAVALPALALTDLDAVLRFLLMHPSRPVIENVLWVCLRRCSRRRSSDLARRPAGTMTTVPAALARGRSRRDDIRDPRCLDDFERRERRGLVTCRRQRSRSCHSRWPRALRLWQTSSRPMRLGLISACTIYVCLPLAYGPASVAAKAWRYPAAFRPASSGLYNPMFARAGPARRRRSTGARLRAGLRRLVPDRAD